MTNFFLMVKQVLMISHKISKVSVAEPGQKKILTLNSLLMELSIMLCYPFLCTETVEMGKSGKHAGSTQTSNY